ncbi:ribonucleotide reductase stimulatory protein [Populibacterium corticicola]|uniref:Ribonucleotide reductase stimulatory protein n=1 Tax=Populibacterium corticicola TaxID=1812826 RepID=A0ABW5XE15_9MICO
MRQTPIYFYSSKSGMARQFALALKRPVFDLTDRAVRTSVPDGPWVLLTPSYKTGNADNDTVPEPVKRFLRDPAVRRKMVGIMGSGNRNFGAHYQAAARQIANISGRPMLFEFELQGTQWDVEDARAILEELDRQLAHAHGEEPAKQSIA